jgi:hypothetical protein
MQTQVARIQRPVVRQATSAFAGSLEACSPRDTGSFAYLLPGLPLLTSSPVQPCLHAAQLRREINERISWKSSLLALQIQPEMVGPFAELFLLGERQSGILRWRSSRYWPPGTPKYQTQHEILNYVPSQEATKLGAGQVVRDGIKTCAYEADTSRCVAVQGCGPKTQAMKARRVQGSVAHPLSHGEFRNHRSHLGNSP